MLIKRNKKSPFASINSFGMKPRTAMRKLRKIAEDLLISPGKIMMGRPAGLRLALKHIARHAFIAGGSGDGKSKMTELIIRQIATQGGGCTVIDPHGDVVKAVLRYLDSIGFDPQDILYLEPRIDSCFAFDPAADAPRGVSRIEYEQWLAATVDRIVKAILRNVSAADQDVMNRLDRWLKNVLTACMVAVDDQNTHVGIDKALVFTDPKREEFHDLYLRVMDHLPADVRSDFDKLIATKRGLDQEHWLESTINRLRKVLSPIMRLIFGQHAAPINLGNAIEKSQVVLVNLAESIYLSREQGNMIGGLIINLLLGTARRIKDENKRVTHFLIIDEAENYIGEDLRMAFAELRKFKLVVILIFQDLTCLKKGELDLVGKVISQCGLQMSFHQGNPDDSEFLAKAYGYGSLDFTPLLTTTVVPNGVKWEDTKSVTLSMGTSRTESFSHSETRTQSTTRQTHTAESIQEQVSLALSQTEGQSSGWGESASKSLTKGTATSQQESSGESKGISAGVSTGQTVSKSVGLGTSLSLGKSVGHSIGDTETRSKSHTDGETWGSSHGESHQESKGSSATDSEQSSQSTTSGTSEQVSDGRSSGFSHGEGSAFSSSGNLVTSRNDGGNFGSNSSRGSGRSSSGTSSESKSSSESKTESSSDGTTDTTSNGGSESWTNGSSQGTSETWTEGTTRGNTVSGTQAVTHGQSDGASLSLSSSLSSGKSTGTTESTSAGETKGTSLTGSTSKGKGITVGVSTGRGASSGSSEGKSEGKSVGDTVGHAQAKTDGVSITLGKTPIAQHLIEHDQPTGKLLHAVSDQLAQYQNLLASLPERTLLVKVKGMGIPFTLAVHEVAPAKEADVPAFLARMQSAHGCFFDPRTISTPATSAVQKKIVNEKENGIA